MHLPECALQYPFSDFTLSFVGEEYPQNVRARKQRFCKPYDSFGVSFVRLCSFVPKVKSVVIIAWFLQVQILHFVQSFCIILVIMMKKTIFRRKNRI